MQVVSINPIPQERDNNTRVNFLFKARTVSPKERKKQDSKIKKSLSRSVNVFAGRGRDVTISLAVPHNLKSQSRAHFPMSWGKQTRKRVAWVFGPVDEVYFTDRPQSIKRD